MPRHNDPATDSRAGPLASRTRHEPTAATAAASAPGAHPYTRRATTAAAPAVKRHSSSRSLPGQLSKATRPLSRALTLLPLLLLGALVACCACSASAARELLPAAAGAGPSRSLLPVPTSLILSQAGAPIPVAPIPAAAAAAAATTTTIPSDNDEIDNGKATTTRLTGPSIFGERTNSLRQGWSSHQ